MLQIFNDGDWKLFCFLTCDRNLKNITFKNGET